MSYENIPTDIEDFDNVDLSNETTGYPVLRPQNVEFVVEKIEDVTFAGSGQRAREVTLKTTQVNPDTAGNDVHPGYIVRHRIFLTVTEKRSATRIKKELAEFREAVLGNHEGAFGPPETWAEQYYGKTLVAKTKIEKDKKGEYPDKTGISHFVKPKA